MKESERRGFRIRWTREWARNLEETLRKRDPEKEVHKDNQNRREQLREVKSISQKTSECGGGMCREREGAPDPVFDISPCSVDKGCHPLVLGALTAVCSHHPSPAQETIDQPDSTALACVCVIVHMCVLCCSVGKNMCKQRLCASARARVFLHLCVCLFVPGLKCQNLHWSCTELAPSTRLSLCFYMSVLLFVMS